MSRAARVSPSSRAAAVNTAELPWLEPQKTQRLFMASGVQRGEARFHVVRDERLDHGVEVALDEVREIVERDFNAMIGHAVLREIVGADFFTALAGADLLFAMGGIFCVLL